MNIRIIIQDRSDNLKNDEGRSPELYRDYDIDENELLDWTDPVNEMIDSLNCYHVCRSDCRRDGCNCNCGEWHTEIKNPN